MIGAATDLAARMVPLCGLAMEADGHVLLDMSRADNMCCSSSGPEIRAPSTLDGHAWEHLDTSGHRHT